MDKRHYIPAASIAHFSFAPVDPPRRSCVFVARSPDKPPYVQRAEQVGWMRGIYGDGKDQIYDCDEFFKPFEVINDSRIDPVLDSLSEWRDANTWIELAEYIASCITRGIDTEVGLKGSMDEWKSWGVAYPFDFMRISAAVFRTRWTILHFYSDELILNDRGYFGMYSGPWKGPTIIFPLRRNSAVMIGGGKRFKKQIVRDNGRWKIFIPASRFAPSEEWRCNVLSWAGRRNECYASSSDLITTAQAFENELPKEVTELAQGIQYIYQALGSSLSQRMNDEQLFWKLINGIREPDVSETCTELFI